VRHDQRVLQAFLIRASGRDGFVCHVVLGSGAEAVYLRRCRLGTLAGCPLLPTGRRSDGILWA
jgi:hypothetical protein